MEMIDRAISLISPKWAAERLAWRKIEASYQGGVPTRTSESWQRAAGYRFGSAADRSQLLSARDRAYQAYRNNPVARTLVQTETDNVIGDGLNYQPTSSSSEWNREAKDHYYQWLETCSVRGSDIQTGCELQRLLWDRSRVAGDIGWILVARGFDSLVQVAPSENIVSPDVRLSDPTIYDGIRFDPQGKPLAFYVLNQDERGRRDFTEIAARDFVYLSHMPEANQARGESCYATIFDLLAHLDRYVDGVSLAAWMATVMGIIFKQNNSGTQFGQLPSLTNSQGNQQKAVTFENGMVKYIGTDEEVAQVQASQPMQQTPEFIRAMYRMLGQPFDMPLEVIAKDMSVCTFASARIGLIPFYRSCRIKAARFGSRWSRTIRWWLSRERLRPDDDPKKWTTAFPADYWNHDLLPNAFSYTDPISEPQSDLLQIDMGTKSPQMVMTERGVDPDAVLQQITEWRQKTGELPEIRSTLTRDPTPKAGTDPNAPNPELDRLKAEADAYGIGVRAGVVTPQTDDEEQFRGKLNLPAMSDDAKKAWEEDKGVRRPITLVQAHGNQPPQFGQSEPAPPEPNQMQKDVVRSLLQDREKRDIIYNVADVPALLTDAGLKLDADVDSADGEALPMLPDVPDEKGRRQ
jgi:capsid protein